MSAFPNVRHRRLQLIKHTMFSPILIYYYFIPTVLKQYDTLTGLCLILSSLGNLFFREYHISQTYFPTRLQENSRLYIYEFFSPLVDPIIILEKKWLALILTFRTMIFIRKNIKRSHTLQLYTIDPICPESKIYEFLLINECFNTKQNCSINTPHAWIIGFFIMAKTFLMKHYLIKNQTPLQWTNQQLQLIQKKMTAKNSVPSHVKKVQFENPPRSPNTIIDGLDFPYPLG